MSWVFFVLTILFLLDAMRMHRRLSALKTAEGPARPEGEAGRAIDPDADDEFEIVAAPGVEIDSAARDLAIAHARAHGLEVLDLVPRDLPSSRAMSLAQLVDVGAYRKNAMAGGRTVGHAMLVSEKVKERALLKRLAADDPVAFVKLASRLKHYAGTTADFAVFPELHAVREDPNKRRAAMREAIGGAVPVVLVTHILVLAALVFGVLYPPSRTMGIAALAAFHLQPLLATAGTRLLPRDLGWMTLFRLPLEAWIWLRTVTGRWRPEGEEDLVAERRPMYDELLQGDLARFFEPRRETCPLCDSEHLTVHLRTSDLLQHKPGHFTLERCRDCSHIFQNPRLTIEGLDFYYKDFYDGLGERGMEFIFGYQPSSYLGRARMVKEQTEPARWLDVGCGHGHFAVVARDVCPSTRFDGLDLSESIDEAARRGWVETGYRGLFPDVAPELESQYDVVSMSHYLEHTLDPRAELEAAHTALAPGGHLLIEVPDPQSLLGRLLGRYWIPWFQPQHQHLISVKNLRRLLEESGFTPVEWHRGEAHQRVDFLFAAFLFLDRIAPPSNLPWRRPASLPARTWRGLVWLVGAPVVLLARATDRLLDPAVRRLGMSNTYRVLARRN